MKTRVIILLAMFLSAFAFLHDRTIKGTVTDGTHNPVAGVNVSIQGSGPGTVTDHAGRFSIRVPNARYVGFCFKCNSHSNNSKIGSAGG
jgi:Ca-activated chloride channel family protein